MAKWKPGNSVAASEHIARRLFDEPMLFGTFDQPHFGGLDIRNFQETRGQEFSVDRMGASSCDKRVVRYLEPRAEHSGRKFQKPKIFCGWAYLPARKLIKPATGNGYRIVASPVREPESEWDDNNLEQNEYHGHILIPDDVTSELFALRIKDLFTRRGGGGGVHPASNLSEDLRRQLVPESWSSRALRHLRDVIKREVGRARSLLTSRSGQIRR
jgi:hypothetical protein